MKNTGAFNKVEQPDFKKNEIVPVIVQDATTDKVLVFGYMNKEAYQKSKSSGKVCFYDNVSREVVTKGEIGIEPPLIRIMIGSSPNAFCKALLNQSPTSESKSVRND